ncbi:MAG: CoxG family protein [Candidatus Bathyarchaeia archaeon]
MQESSRTFRIAAPIEKVFNFVKDVEQVGWCIAGVKEVKAISPTQSEWKVTVTAGIISQTITFKVVLNELKETSFMSFSGEGRNLKFSGSLELTAAGPTETDATFKAVVEATGAFARLIDLIMGNTADKLAEETVQKIKARLEDPTMAAGGSTSISG